MSKETSLNLMNLDFGRNPEYGEGVFVQKVSPSTEKISQEELKECISARGGQEGKSNRLTRREFSEGTPGLLFVQAVALMGAPAEGPAAAAVRVRGLSFPPFAPGAVSRREKFVLNGLIEYRIGPASAVKESALSFRP